MKVKTFSSPGKQSVTSPGFPPDIRTVFFEYFPDPLFIWDWQSGTLLESNRAAEKVLGYSAPELRKMDMYSLLPEDVTDRLPALFRKEQKENGFSMRTTLCSKAGRQLPVEIRTRLLQAGGSTLRCMVLRDLSGKEAGTVETRLEDITDIFPHLFGEQEMVFEISAEGFVTEANAICLRKTGYTRQDLCEGIHFIQAIIPEEREYAHRDFQRLLRGERLDTLEYTLLCRDGETLPAIISFCPVEGEGGVRGVRGLAFDITEHRRIENNLVIREKLNLLGELTGGVVHNVNNVLAVILGYLDILPLENLDDNTRRIMMNIRRAASDGVDIVRRIQNFSRSDQAISAKPSDLNGIVREVLESMKPRFGTASRPVSVEAGLQPVPLVLVTPFEMREVLSNIVINALDAMPGGGVLTITTETRGEYTALMVADTGTGMSEETRRRLFEPFFTTKGENGTGIGLSASSAIIGKFGGKISVDSAPGRGTTVTILLPRVPEPAEPEPLAAIPECPSGNCSILVIDDESNICEILQEFLARAGHRVITAQGGAPGLALLKEQTFDILITDLNMPGVSGWEIARQVRRIAPQTFIIMLTGWGTRIEEINRGERLVDHLLIKPISFSALSEVIERAAGRK